MSAEENYINNALDRIAQRFFPDIYAKKVKQALDNAFEIFSVSIILDKPMEEVYENLIIRGNEDGGIDAVYLENNNGAYILHIFQCKNVVQLGTNMLEKFQDNYDEIFVRGNKKKARSNDLQKKLNAINYYTLSNRTLIERRLYFVFKGLKSDADNINQIREIGNTKFEYWDRRDLQAQMFEYVLGDTRSEVKFTFRPENSNLHPRGGEQALISFSILNVRSVMFRVSAYDLCNLIETEKKVNGRIGKLFSENIRGFLGRDNFTNSRILQTLQDRRKKYFFPLLNNGITMICSRINLPDEMQDGHFLLPTTNPVIVNGLQTTNIIYEQYQQNPDSLNGVFVTIRLYETEDAELIDYITDATNTQSAIDFRDKLSNKPFMKTLKAFFAEHGVALITKRGEAFQHFYNESVLQYTIENTAALRNWYHTFVAVNTYHIDDYGQEHEDLIDVIKSFFEIENTPEHPLYPFLHEKLENFVSQVFWINRCNRCLKQIIKDLSSYEYRQEDFDRYYYSKIIAFLLLNKKYTKASILETVSPIIECLYTKEAAEQTPISARFPTLLSMKLPALTDLQNLYIPTE
jgi:AIPR protein